MKKTLAMLLALVMSLGLLAACAQDPETCNHEWSAWTVVTAATCTEDGEESRTCSVCGTTETREIAASHTWGEWVTVTEQTCEQDGLNRRECSVCHTTEEETLPAFGPHDYEVTKPGTCIDGTTYTCSKCGESYTAESETDPTNHLGTPYACGAHCNWCSTDTTADDHRATSCGISGHYVCDGFDHIQCAIPVDTNMQFTEIDNGTAYRLDGFNAAGEDTEIIVPAYVNGKPVTEIGEEIITGLADDEIGTWLNTVTYIYLPDTVTTIDSYFAYMMDSLETVRLPKAVETWEQHTFFDCVSLTRLNIPRGVETIDGNFGFSNVDYESALETISVPTSFTDLDCLRLFYVVKSDIAIAYEGTEEEWAALVADVSDADLKAALEATSVTYGYDYNAQYEEESNALQIRISDFQFDSVEGGYAITGYTGDAVETLVIPAAIGGVPVVSIAAEMLSAADNPNLVNVKEVDFSEATNLTSIGDYNFYTMDALEKVVLPDTIEYVGSQCFYDCPNLTEVYIGENTEMDITRAPFAYCENLAKVTLPEYLRGTFTASAFAESNTSVEIVYGGNTNSWYLVTKDATNMENLSVTYNYGATVEQDNGQEFVLNADGESYTLVGFYDTVKAGDPAAPVAVYTVPTEFNGKPVTGIGTAVFNVNAYENEDVSNWLATGMAALIIGVMNIEGEAVTYSDNNVTSLGYYNFVGMEACAQLRVPTTITNKKLVGCYVDMNAVSFIRVPRGVEVMEDCFQWSGKFLGGVAARWLILPASLQSFTGNSWSSNAGGQPENAFGIVMDTTMEKAPSALDTLLNNSPCERADWAAIVAFIQTFSGAGLVQGEGGTFSYDQFTTIFCS